MKVTTWSSTHYVHKSGMDKIIHYIKQSYQDQVRGQATLPKHIIDPLSMVYDFDNDIIINTYDIIKTYGMI